MHFAYKFYFFRLKCFHLCTYPLWFLSKMKNYRGVARIFWKGRQEKKLGLTFDPLNWGVPHSFNLCLEKRVSTSMVAKPMQGRSQDFLKGEARKKLGLTFDSLNWGVPNLFNLRLEKRASASMVVTPLKTIECWSKLSWGRCDTTPSASFSPYSG